MQERSVTILLVDYDASYVSVAQQLLHTFQNTKFNLISENSGENALQQLISNASIDMILMDYYLPDRNGVELVKTLAEQKNLIPIIFLTSNKDFHVAVEVMKYGVEEYLLKEDIVDTILPRTILNVLERVRLRNQIRKAEQEKLISQKRTEAIQELIVTMCHEFNNPLAAIKISADILSRQKISDEDRNFLLKLNSNIMLLEKQIIKLRDLNLDRKNSHFT